MYHGMNITLGGLIHDLQEIASRYGNDVAVASYTGTDADYEQVTAPIVLHAVRESVPDDWDLFRVDADGEVVVVIQ